MISPAWRAARIATLSKGCTIRFLRLLRPTGCGARRIAGKGKDVMLQNPLPIRFVLTGTSHPGNIGAAARAMKNMALDQLWLVAPKLFPHAEATARASGADDLLYHASVCEQLSDAIDDCGLVIGASARLRSLPWPVVSPRDCAKRVVAVARDRPAAIVFGNEQSGLSNAEMQRCHFLVHIPANPQYRSLNLAMAVQILAYEVMLARGGEAEAREEQRALGVASRDMENFYAHLETVLIDIGFLNPQNPRHLMRRLRRLFNRAEPDANELNILRGILSAMERRRGTRVP